METYEFKDNVNIFKGDEISLILNKKSLATGIFPKAYEYKIILNNQNVIVGWLDFQLAPSKEVFYRGHISYGIDEEHRGHNYASKAINLIKWCAKEHNFNLLVITCDPDNIASLKSIERAGAKLLGVFDIPEDHELAQYGVKQKCIYELSL